MKNRDVFTLVIEVEPYNKVPGICRLKTFLKRALRDWRIRCRSIRALPDEPASASAPAESPD